MRFAAPAVLWFLLLLPVAAAAAWAAARARRRRLERFAGGRAFLGRFTAQASAHRRVAKLMLLFGATGFGIVAAARPQWGTRLEPVTRKGVDVVVLLDTSMSMAAADVSPSRLDQARHAASSLLGRLEGDRVGLVTFAGHPVVDCPLTLDVEAARLLLGAVEVELEPVQGTALADALRAAARLLAPHAEPDGAPRGKVIVLFSDGEDHEGGLHEALAMLARAGIRVFAVGFGTPGGAPIPLRAADGSLEGYKKDREGRIVTTRLVEDTLRRAAAETAGRYFRATPAEVEIETIAKEIRELEAGEAGTLLRTRYEERFQLPLALAVLSLFAEALLSDRRGARPERLVRLFRVRWRASSGQPREEGA